METSFFDIYKIGPGPSSSHTIGPMKAAFLFVKEAEDLPKNILHKATHIKIDLYGSLSATGKGHGVNRAILAGFLKYKPYDCNVEKLLKFFQKKGASYKIKIKDKIFIIDEDSFNFKEIHHLFPHANTMIIKLFAKDKILLEREYYSLGGGFIQCKGEKKEEEKTPKFPYKNMQELKELLKKNKISLIDLLMKNEMSITKKNKKTILKNLKKIFRAMEASVLRGLRTKGVLPGPLKLKRKAPFVYKKLRKDSINFLHAYALAASEENAAGHLIVTAPTSGACGVIPALLFLLKKQKVKESLLLEGLMVASMIAFIVKNNASISGAEVGCQGEIGVASAMGAAMLCHIHGYGIEYIEVAAEIGLEHFLGLTCDPIQGYVQIPCIERNAVAALKAYHSFILATSLDPKDQKISFDQVVDVMLKTGKDMCLKYKETSKGGLALLKE